MTAVSDSAPGTRQSRAIALSLAPEALAVLRLVRVEQTDWPEAVRREANGAPITGMLPRKGGGWVYSVEYDVTSIGRGLQNDLVLLDPAVSREHARLVRTRQGWWIENVSDRNPLWVSDIELPARHSTRIFPSESLVLGGTTLELIAPRPSSRDGPPSGARAITPIDDTPLVPLAAEEGAHGDPARGRTTAEITLQELGGTNLLNPGVTLQFALIGKLGPRARWILGGLALFIFLLFGVLTLGLAALIGQDAAARDGLGHVLYALTIPLIPTIGIALLVAALDRYEREPPLVLLAAFLWGAIIAVPPVLFVERALNGALLSALGGDTGTAFAPSISLALSAGLTEETIKGAGLLLLLWVLRDEFDNVTDGVIYGALIGAGFAMVENFVYFALTPPPQVGVLIVGRLVLGWLAHSTFTALFGAGLGYAREKHRRPGAWRAPVIGFAASLLLHTLFDFVAFSAEAASSSATPGDATLWLGLATILLDYVPLFAAQAILLRMLLAALEREAATVREYLASEVTGGFVTPDEYVLLQYAKRRAALERQYALTAGWRIYLTARALHQTAIGLAFRKWHVAQGDPPKAAARQPEDAYRERIVRLRRSLRRQLRKRERATRLVVMARNQ